MSTNLASTLGPISETTLARICRASLVVDTRRPGFTEITNELAQFLRQAQAGDGLLNVFVRHTSASLTVQENADPDVRTDLMTALDRLAPRDVDWVHDAEGPDDMPAHVRTMVTDASLVLPVAESRLQLGTWQGVYLIEHRDRPHRRTIVLTYSGS